MALSGDPYVFGAWKFAWYTPDQDIRPAAYLRALGIPVPATPPVPFLISNPDAGQTVRFQSLLGAYGPPYIPVDQDIPFLPGSQLKFVNVEEAEVDLRILFQADTQQLLWAMLAPFPYMFNPLRGLNPTASLGGNINNGGAGILQVTNPAGQVRLLNATCISGFKLDPSTLQEKSVEATLTFYANDPYWYGGSINGWNIVEFQFDPASGFIPVLPGSITGAPGRTAGPLQLIKPAGDVNTYGAFLFSAPYINPKIINQTISFIEGQNNSIAFFANGGVNSTPGNIPLLVDCINKTATRPGLPVQPVATQNVISKMNQNSAFFPLLPSQQNTLYFEIGGATANSGVQIFYQDAYSSMI